jgi:hypothetical protein
LKYYLSQKKQTFPHFLVGYVEDEEKREIQAIEGLKKGDEFACSYLETFPNDTTGIDVVVEDVAKQVIKTHRQEMARQISGARGGLFDSVSEAN